jgi:putative transposase
MRFIPENGYLHVMCRGNNRRNVFIKPKDYRFYLWLVGNYKKEAAVNIIHYCIMPNHAHFMVRVTPKTDLATFMKRVNLVYFFYFRKKRQYVGHLWQGRFKSKLIETDSYFVQCGKYIELNPVRRRLCGLPEEWEFSSYKHYAYGENDDLVEDDPFYINLGKTPQKRQAYYRELITSEIVTGKMTFRKPMKNKELQGEGTSLDFA